MAAFTGGGRLVVLIDDLDRCTPEGAVTVLDSLKLFLGQASCVFVLAMDPEVIASAVATRFGGDAELGRQYLEKLVPFPFHLPYVTDVQLRRSVCDQVTGLGDDPALWELVRVAFGPNPRRARRFVNALNLTVLTLETHSPPSWGRMIHAAELIALRLRFPEFFALVVKDPDVWGSAEEAARRGDGGLDSTLRGNPGLGELLLAVSPQRTDMEFPPLPGRAEIETLTNMLTVTTGIESAA